MGAKVDVANNTVVSVAQAELVWDQRDTSPDPSPNPDPDPTPDPEPTPEPVTMAMTLRSTSSSGTSVAMSIDDVSVGSISVARRTRVAEADLGEIGLEISATKGQQVASVGVNAGRLGVASAGESDGQWAMSGNERMVFTLVDDDWGDGLHAEFRFVDAGRGETVWIETFADGVTLGRTEVSAQGLVVFDAKTPFDRITLSAGSGDSFALTEFEVTREGSPDLFLA